MQHSENFVTDVLERVAARIYDMNIPPQVTDLRWESVNMVTRQQIKETLLPVVLSTLDAAKDVRGPVEVATSWPLLDDEVAEQLVAADFDSDGRSEWRWLRTGDGDLMLGIYPQGGTFESLDQGPAADDFDAALKAEGDAGVSYHRIDLED